MIKPEVLDAMVAAGCTAEQIVAAVKASMAGEEERKASRRANNAERQRRFRERNKSNALHDVTGVSNAAPSSPEVSPHTPLPNPSNHLPPSPPKGGSSPTDRAISVFVEHAERAGISVPRKITADRRRKIEARLREHGEDAWGEACRKMAESAFCRGENDRGWRADLDFLCQPKSFNGLLEGRYDNRTPSRSTSPPPGRRMNAVEAYLSMKSEQSHEPASRTIDHRNDELLPTDEPRLQALAGQLGQALRWPDGSSHH